jgi:hypothetical protein
LADKQTKVTGLRTDYTDLPDNESTVHDKPGVIGDFFLSRDFASSLHQKSSQGCFAPEKTSKKIRCTDEDDLLSPIGGI